MRGFCVVTLLMAVPASAADTPDMRGAPFAMQGGEAVYRGVCQGCHMADAKGASGAGTYPALAGNPKLAEPGYVLSMVMNGHRGMPPFGGQFSNGQAADVVNFVRSHFGNHYKGKVTEADAQALR
ncbi:MAG: cytochrome c [Alphaproteobacteria bacterium]|nr:cytochrome c [Alphaproteobacteria bacterium]